MRRVRRCSSEALAGRAYDRRIGYFEAQTITGAVERYGPRGRYVAEPLVAFASNTQPLSALWQSMGEHGALLTWMAIGHEDVAAEPSDACTNVAPLGGDDVIAALRTLAPKLDACAAGDAAFTFDLRSHGTRLKATRFAGPKKPGACLARVISTMRLDRARLLCHPLSLQFAWAP